MRKRLFFLAILFTILSPASAQRRLLPGFVRRMLFEKDSSRRPSFFLLPVVASAPETGLEIGASALYSFYSDTLTKGTRVSNLFAYGTFTTKGQQRLSLSSNYWTSQNRWHYTATASFINFPANFYGIGQNTLDVNKDRLGQKRFRASIQAEKLISKSLYAGVAVGGFDYSFGDGAPGSIFFTDKRVEDRKGGSSLFAGPVLIFDTRNNNTYTTSGLIINSYFNFYQGLFRNNGYNGGLFNIEYSQFFKLSPKFVLGINIQDQNLTGERSPFYLLPTLGSDELMRGYYNGRYRDRNLIAGQTELRYRLSDRIGIVGFAGTGTVFNRSLSLDDLKPNYGGGLRYFFDVQKGLSFRLDYGFGEKRPGESRQSGLYLSLGEAF